MRGARRVVCPVQRSSVTLTLTPNPTASPQVVPHYYLTVDLLLDKLLAVRERLNRDLEDDEKLSVNDFFLKAAALASKQVSRHSPSI